MSNCLSKMLKVVFSSMNSFAVPEIVDVNNNRHQIIFQELMHKDFSLFSEEETQFFLTFKETQYEARKTRIEKYCQEGDTSYVEKMKKIRPNSLIYDKPDGISYCQIAKVASSSWCNHFIKLGKFDLSRNSHHS